MTMENQNKKTREEVAAPLSVNLSEQNATQTPEETVASVPQTPEETVAPVPQTPEETVAFVPQTPKETVAPVPQTSEETVAFVPQTSEENVANDVNVEVCETSNEKAEPVAESADDGNTRLDDATTAETNATPEPMEANVEGSSAANETNVVAEKVDECAALLQDVLKTTTTLCNDFEVKIKYDNSKQEQINRLYDECKAYRDDVFWALKKELILDVIAEIDDVEKRAAHFAKLVAQASEGSTSEVCEKLLKFVREIAENLRFTLEKHDVFSYSAPAGSRFDPATQRALETKPTNDETLDKTIEPLRKGFDYEANGKKRNLRKEIVYVYKYEPPTVVEEPVAPTQNAETPSVANVEQEASVKSDIASTSADVGETNER
jgi:molecular chaperone GrpE (heat shock protein)